MEKNLRKSNARTSMAEILRGSPGHLVMMDLGDNAGFLQGINWPNAPTLADWIAACQYVGNDLNVIYGEANYLPETHPLGRKRLLVSDDGHRQVMEIVLPTPDGELVSREASEPGMKPARTNMFIDGEDDYRAVIGYLQALRECGEAVVAHLAGYRREIGEAGFLSIFIPQPMEMFYLILQEQMVYDFLDYPGLYAEAMREVEETGHFIIDCAAQAGADMIVFGGAGTEIFNAEMIEKHIMRPSIGFVEHSRSLGLFSLMHCCGRTRLYLERGWFTDLQPDIFESFTPAPLGDILSPREAVDQLSARTFFKGGLSLELLLNGNPETIADAVSNAYATFGHRRFILAGSCGILTGTPRENLLAVTKAACKETP